MNRARIKRDIQSTQCNGYIRKGFTLVELLVVITIIGVLVGIALPTIGAALRSARDGARKFEVTEIADAVEKYYLEHNDYPPDGSSLPVMQRHIRKLFPRMQEPDASILVALTHPSGTFSPVAMDRAEALVFFLGGYSKDPAHPFTGPGGPLEFKNYAGDNNPANLANYQYNMNRENGYLTINPDRLDVILDGNRYRSNDEQRYQYTGTDLSLRGGLDLLPTYLAEGGETPLVYFDSRTYGHLGSGVYNGYQVGGEYGEIRPYKTSLGAAPPSPPATSYGTTENAFDAIKFVNANTYQVIHPGGDNVFGALVSDNSSTPLPVHFLVETGQAVGPYSAASNIDELRLIVYGTGTRTFGNFSDSDVSSVITESGHRDNITNFSSSTLESDLP